MVDDELDNRVMMRYFLESWGYEVELAANGKEALEKVAAQRPALILLDLEMPVMDGFEACNLLKTDPETEDIPVIMFTGLEATADKVKGIRKGADDYVVKTVDPEEIQARIEMILRRSQRYERPTATSGNGDGAVLSGSLEDKSFPEAFQLAMAYGESGTLELKNGDDIGNVFLIDGDVVHAEYGELESEDAFYELALWDKGQFSYKVGDSTLKRTIEASGQSLLMEATRRMDEWNLIASKIPSFDVVLHRIASGASEPIRLTKADWNVLSRMNGEKTLRQLSEELGTDPHETGRVIFGLLNAGIVAFEADEPERDSFFDAVPELRDAPKGPKGEETFELSPVQWKLLTCIDGVRDLGTLTHLIGLSPRKMASALKELAEKGFLRINKSRPKSEGAGAAAPQAAANTGSNVEAFQPRIRAVGLD
jgi:CheY-like chemotaxis protein/DNA-binding MarR family transcriptional regulator